MPVKRTNYAASARARDEGLRRVKKVTWRVGLLSAAAAAVIGAKFANITAALPHISFDGSSAPAGSSSTGSSSSSSPSGLAPSSGVSQAPGGSGSGGSSSGSGGSGTSGGGGSGTSGGTTTTSGGS